MTALYFKYIKLNYLYIYNENNSYMAKSESTQVSPNGIIFIILALSPVLSTLLRCSLGKSVGVFFSFDYTYVPLNYFQVARVLFVFFFFYWLFPPRNQFVELAYCINWVFFSHQQNYRLDIKMNIYIYIYIYIIIIIIIMIINIYYYYIISIDSIDILKRNYPNWVFNIKFMIHVNI